MAFQNQGARDKNKEDLVNFSTRAQDFITKRSYNLPQS